MQNEILIELHVPDFNAVKSFYGVFGFQIVREDPSTSDGGGYLVMARENSHLCFWPGDDSVYSQAYFGQFPADTKRGYGVEIVIGASDIEDLYEKVKTSAKVVEPLELRPWGLKDFRVEDPFGYYLRFTEPQDVKTGGHREL